MVALVFALYGAPREAAAAPGVEPASPDDVDGLSAEEISAADLSGTWQTFHIPGAVLSVAPADPRPGPPAASAPADAFETVLIRPDEVLRFQPGEVLHLRPGEMITIPPGESIYTPPVAPRAGSNRVSHVHGDMVIEIVVIEEPAPPPEEAPAEETPAEELEEPAAAADGLAVGAQPDGYPADAEGGVEIIGLGELEAPPEPPPLSYAHISLATDGASPGSDISPPAAAPAGPGACQAPERAIAGSSLERSGPYQCCGNPGYPEWLSVPVAAAVLAGAEGTDVDAFFDTARAVYAQCCIEIEARHVEVLGAARTEALVGADHQLDEVNLLEDDFGIFRVSDEQRALIDNPPLGDAGVISAWFAARSRASEVGYVLRTPGVPRRTLIITGELDPDRSGNDIVLAHEVGHVLLERAPLPEHHEHRYPDNLMAWGRINTGAGELSADQCGWMRQSALLRPR